MTLFGVRAAQRADMRLGGVGVVDLVDGLHLDEVVARPERAALVSPPLEGLVGDRVRVGAVHAKTGFAVEDGLGSSARAPPDHRQAVRGGLAQGNDETLGVARLGIVAVREHETVALGIKAPERFVEVLTEFIESTLPARLSVSPRLVRGEAAASRATAV